MAIDLGRADFNSLFGVTEIAERGSRGLDALNLLELSNSLDTDNLVQHIIDNLENKIKLLKDNEQKFLDMFDCKSTQQFKDRVRNYYDYTNLYKFTGSELDVLIKDFSDKIKEDEKQEDALIMRIFYNLAQNTFEKELGKDFIKALEDGEVTESIAQRAQHYLLLGLSGAGYGKGGNLGSKGANGLIGSKKPIFSVKTGTDGKNYLQPLSRNMTEAFREHLESMKKKMDHSLSKVNKNKKQKILENKELLKGTSTIDFNEDSFTQTFVVDWSDMIQKATTDNSGKSNKIKSHYLAHKGDNDALKDFNNTIIEYILNYLNLPTEGGLRNFAKKRMQDMCHENPALFFIGKSDKALIGVLGEINAVVAITNLLGKKYSSKALQWVGGVNDNSSNSKALPSVDIVLKEIGGLNFGVQIKNTADDLDFNFSHYVRFADKSVEKTFEQLGLGEGNVLRNVYIADTYNVPAKRIGNKYEQVDYDTEFEDTLSQATFLEYVRIDKLIDKIVSELNLFLTLFAPDFLYMSLGEDFKSKLASLNAATEKTGGNYVYIVGKQVYFAQDILLQLQNDLKALQQLQIEQQQMSFKLEAYFEKIKGDKNKFTIVEAWNTGSHLSNHTIKLKSGFVFRG